MANRYYREGAERGAQVEALFDTIARRYDLVNDLQSLGLHRAWKRAVVQEAEMSTGKRALDLCCGTGDLAFGLSAAGGEVVGLDFSGAMLTEAMRKRASSPRWIKT